MEKNTLACNGCLLLLEVVLCRGLLRGGDEDDDDARAGVGFTFFGGP